MIMRVKNRQSIRLKDYDYASEGIYYVTICVFERECLFGNVQDGQMILNDYGEMIEYEWKRTEEIRSNINVDYFVIMPNHIHGIIHIVGAHCNVPLQSKGEQFGRSTKNSIPTIVKLFKSTTTKQINQTRRTPGAKVWQRNYYEHVIRDASDLNRIREYVVNNPLNWDKDKYYV